VASTRALTIRAGRMERAAWCTWGYWTAMSFMEIFQPGLKYLREERDRSRMDVVYPTNGGNPPMRIDLDAGTATIVVPVPVPVPVPEQGDEST
jgi:hypothetical protein